ncbi:MAG: fatty acid cis/trans isomerase, partial [Halioglobus sp.]|nr:fatty acid cis/trans isomerase [Halioglobus sp.]
RYIYEHLFIASLYLDDVSGANGFYQLVRSSTPPGTPIDIIATRRPYDDPGVKRVYYRLMPQRTSVLAKRHMPYALHQQRLQRWQSLFLDARYTVSQLPGYDSKTASNPFVAFRELPLNARYRFMLDEAQFTIMAYIKGPVCRGSVALNVIDDHFWVVFLDPDSASSQHSAEFLASESGNLRLPSAMGGTLISLVQWDHYAKNQLQFLKAKMQYIERQAANTHARVDVGLVWDGDGENPNASLTVFRHNDSASVVKGLVGRQPKTAWIIDYSLLERIHYLLVAGFDVYGNVAHQLETRLYMDFLRMEGEQNFLLLLPAQARIALRDFWYRGADDHVKQYVVSDSVAFDRDSDIRYRSDDPKAELLDMLKGHVHGAAAPRYQPVDARFEPLLALTGKPVALLPEVAFVQVLMRNGDERFYSLVHNNGYSNNAQLFREEARRIEAEDYVTVANGFIGAYPNVFFQFPETDLPGFVQTISAMQDEKDYANLVSRYGVRRTAPWIWRLSDSMTAHYRATFPREAGLFDLNRYENR